MVTKLLLTFFTFSILFLNPFEGLGQCPTSVSISADPGKTFCEGTEITFSADIQDNNTYNYQWLVNETEVSDDHYTYTSNSLSNGDKVKVVVTSADDSNNCSEPSNELTMTVKAVRTPTVSVTSTKTSICHGENITFSTNPTNQGSTPNYEWFVNGNNTVAKTGSSVTFSSSDFIEGTNSVRVVLTSSLECVTSQTAEAVSDNFELKPDATISSPENIDETTCINSPLDSISFDIGGGGTGANVSGLPSGISGSFDSGTFTISGTPTTAGEFNYTVTTSGNCAQTLASGKITVNPNATIALTSVNNSQTVCGSGGVADANIDPIIYSIGETGTGTNVSGLPTGISESYSNGTLTISGSSSETGTHNFTVTATGTCGPSSVLAGSITITENLAPSVSIISSEADKEICEGTEVTFTATPTNGGSSPSYQWKIDGSNAGSNSNTFSTTSLTNRQSVTVVMTSNETCRTENTATSNGISTTVNPNLEPLVSIDPDNTDICAGDEVVFTAQPVNGGPSPTFQWKVGNTVVGSGESYATSNLSNGQAVTVTMTSSETCITTLTATSEAVVIDVNENLVPSVTIESNDDNNVICTGSSITFTATPTNGGTTPEYQWQINGNASGGVTSSNIFSPGNLSSGDIVTAVLISSKECLAENNVGSNEIPIQVDTSISGVTPVWDSSDTSFNPTAICPVVSGLTYRVNSIEGATSYDWTYPSGWTLTSGEGTNEVTLTAGVNAIADKITVRGRNECGTTGLSELEVTTGTTVYVEAGQDIEVCPDTSIVNLAGEIGGVITKNQDWDWFASINGGEFTSNGFSNGGKSLDGTYTIPTSVRNGGTLTIRIQSIDPAGPCELKTDDRVITILSAATITDATNKNQTVCINSEINDISFTIGGAGKGATATGLPAGVTANFEDGIFTLSGTPTEAGTYNYTVTTTGDCTNASITGTLTINPRPTFTQPEEVFVCAGAETSTISFGGSSVSGTTYQWTNDNNSIGLAATGTGDIIGFTSVNNTNEPVIANISVTPFANNCEGTTEEFQITVYPTTTFTTPANLTVCNGEDLDDIIFAGSNVPGSTYKWSNSNTSIGLAAEGSGNISSFSATNTTNQPIEATITVTPVANECYGTLEEFTITVNPTPAFTAPDNMVVCNGEELSQLEFSGETITGTTFSWTNNNVAIGLAASGTGSLPSFTAVNNGTEPLNAIITVIPSANDCEGDPVPFEITVNPTSTVNSIEDFIVCNGENFSELALTSTVSGTSYSWTNSNPAIGLAGSGTGNIPSFTAKNSTDEAITATITVTPTANECLGNQYAFEITVNPSVTIDAGPDQTICSNLVATMAATLGGGASEGTWTTSGSGTFNNNSINAEYTPSNSDALNGSVILTYTSNDPEGPCGPASATMELLINEEIIITTQPENIGVCSTEPSELTVIASGDNLSYEWKRIDGANIVNSNGIYSSTLSFNNTTSTNSGEYYVIVRGEETCEEVDSEIVTINVDENIIIEEPVTEVPICGDGFSEVTMKFIAHANKSPLTFTWYKDNVEVDADLDENITITTGLPDEDGKYEGTLHLANITTAYNGDYYVEISGPGEFTCSTAVTNPFQLRLDEMPELPVVEDLVVCQNETPESFTVTTGTNLRWYLNEEDEEFIVNESGQPSTPVPATNTPGDFYYWVTQKPAACESKKVQVKVTVKEKPAVPGITSEEAVIEYCLRETAIPLTATSINGATLNWYDSETGEALTSVPTPNTENPGETTYWVSQTPNDGFGCESDRAAITVKVYSLPEVTASAEEGVICLGSPAELSSTGGVSYIWYDGEEEIGSEASISHTPSEAGDYIFTVLVTDTNGCENTAEVNIQVDENTVSGTLTGPEKVCINSPSGTLNLAGYTGEIQRWESSTDGGSNWTEISNTSETYEFPDLDSGTIFRVIVKNGVCEEQASNQIEVTIDPIPIGGELAFEGNGRVFTICENPVGNYAADLNLTGTVGEVVKWGYRNWNSTTYTDLVIGGELFTETTLTAAQIQSLGFNETTVFQVEISSGACAAPAYSKTAILSVIPSDITPSPVEVDPEVVCLGEEVTLSSETGYENGGTFLDQGAFDNASITNHGWRIRRNNNTTDLGFDTDANNTEFDRWKRGTPRQFVTASTTSPFNTSGVLFDTGIEDGNKGFALVSSNNSSTMETPVFSIGAMDEAVLTFDQAYVLTPGAFLKVEISTNGGNSYQTLYIREVLSDATSGIGSGNYSSFGTGTPDTHPENKIVVDLGDYMGFNNLRIRFNFDGARPGDIWAVDNIDVPEGPRGITMEWRDYTDPNTLEGILIGTNNSEKYVPTEIGLNVFEVKTKLVFNSNGDACEVAENAQRIEVFVFDKYTTNVTADYGSCGTFDAQLTATVLNGRNEPVTSYPTPDGYIGRWNIEGGATLVDSDPSDGIDAVNDPNAILSTDATGTYTVSWILEPKEVNENGDLYINPEACPPVVNPLDVVIEGCTALDFDGENDVIIIEDPYSNVLSIEAWIRPKEAEGTIISGPNFHITTPTEVTPNSRWYHIAVSNGKLYIDGIENSDLSLGNGDGLETTIGAKRVDGEPTDFFHGWIEEVRLWKKPLTIEQIRFMMNQRLIPNGAKMGEQIPMDVPGGLTYADLAGYYRLISAEPDPLNLVNFDAAHMPANGETPNLANAAIPGRLINMETNQENTAPLPYFSTNDGLWATDGTWARPDVWDPPHTGDIEWNIARTSNNIQSGGRNIKVLGLISESEELTMINPGSSMDEYNSGQLLHITHYLKLDGVIDLEGESQLLQNTGSIIDEASAGYLDRDQQGNLNSFIYNYWSSPVSTQGSANNGGYSVGSILLDGTNYLNPDPNINYVFDPFAADAARTDPVTISSYWLHGFYPGTVNEYAEWDLIKETGPLKTGEGYTMKGTSGSAGVNDEQNYTFRGKPHNGDINLPMATDQNYLIGNPYASAIDANEFILDNLNAADVPDATNTKNVFDGTIYLWDHFNPTTHILKEYIGGYGALNLVGGVKAISNDERINANEALSDNTPQRFIPVAQAFLVNSAEIDTDGNGSNDYVISGGDVLFKNSQRLFHREGAESIFLQSEVVTKTSKEKTNEIPKIRISFQSPVGYHRQILVGAVPSTTNGFDLGYDARLFDDNPEDMYWLQDKNQLVIQGVPNFDKDQVLPLGIKIAENKPFRIRLDSLQDTPSSMMIYLNDKLNDSIHDLKAEPYISHSEPGYIHKRFEIIFHKEESSSTGAPEEETRFTVKHSYKSNEIQVLNPDLLSVSNVYIFDLNGKQVESYEKLPMEKEVRLKVRNFSSGVYIVKIHLKERVISKKIIISN